MWAVDSRPWQIHWLVSPSDGIRHGGETYTQVKMAIGGIAQISKWAGLYLRRRLDSMVGQQNLWVVFAAMQRGGWIFGGMAGQMNGGGNEKRPGRRSRQDEN
jgi:hypothetical protein